MKMLRRQIVLLGANSLVLRPHSSKLRNLDRNRSMNDLHLEAIYNTLKRELRRNENKEMVRKEDNAMGRQAFVG